MGECVWRTLEKTRPRPTFVIALQINLPQSGMASPGEA